MLIVSVRRSGTERPLACRALTQMGTKKESFVELTERISRTTGGVSVYPFTSSVKGSPDPVAFLMVRTRPVPGGYRAWPGCCWHCVGSGSMGLRTKGAATCRCLTNALSLIVQRTQIRGKAMADRSGDLLELFHDVLLEARLDDRERFRQVSVTADSVTHRMQRRTQSAYLQQHAMVWHSTSGPKRAVLRRALCCVARLADADNEQQQACLQPYRKHIDADRTIQSNYVVAAAADGDGDEVVAGVGHHRQRAQLRGGAAGRAARRRRLGAGADERPRVLGAHPQPGGARRLRLARRAGGPRVHQARADAPGHRVCDRCSGRMRVLIWPPQSPRV